MPAHQRKCACQALTIWPLSRNQRTIAGDLQALTGDGKRRLCSAQELLNSDTNCIPESIMTPRFLDVAQFRFITQPPPRPDKKLHSTRLFRYTANLQLPVSYKLTL
mmetsp:Transcript_22830/g.52241  ORF Transcript_22830/g.52241 Transcript_22830/m.52241 type:complete len:106 (+) Transcript_22830:1904-2221(+)